MRVETQAKLESIGKEIKKLVDDEVFAQMTELYDWAKKQAASHHDIAVEYSEKKDEAMLDQHNALSSAYTKLAEEINVLVRDRALKARAS